MFDFHRALPYDVQMNNRDLQARRDLVAPRGRRSSRWIERDAQPRSRSASSR